jgi:hypothetical protein
MVERKNYIFSTINNAYFYNACKPNITVLDIYMFTYTQKPVHKWNVYI